MSNPKATNAVAPGLDRPYFLQADKEGLPLQGQVPITVEQYTGAGNVSVVPSGKNVYYVNSTLASGALNIDLTGNQNFRNMIGRSLNVYVSPAAGNSVTIDITSNPVNRAFRLTGDTGDVMTITAGGYANLYFIDETNVLVFGSANATTA